MPKILYYPVFVAPGRREGGLSWGKPSPFLDEAARWLIAEMKRLDSSFGTVVLFKDGKKIPLIEHVQPQRARDLIRRWEDLWAITADASTN